MVKKRKIRRREETYSWGAEAFHDHFQQLYGWRWTALRGALTTPISHVAMLNPLLDPIEALEHLEPDVIPVDGLPGCFVMPDDRPFLSPDQLQTTTFPYYLLDGASVMAPMALSVQPGDDILDMCAAPGGKSVWLSRCLKQGGRLTVNEIDGARRQLLLAVMDRYVPRPYRDRVEVANRDATTWGRLESNRYDRVLVDAPCSSERHLMMAGEQGLDRWFAGRSDEMASLQYAILSAALDAVKPGGRIVYSTCSISLTENDEVVERLLQRRGDLVDVVDTNLVWGEPTDLGWQVFPDLTEWGPLYICALQKKR